MLWREKNLKGEKIDKEKNMDIATKRTHIYRKDKQKSD